MEFNKIIGREIPSGWKVENLYKNSLAEIIKPKIDKFDGEKVYLDTSTVNDLQISSGEKITYENRASRANMQPVSNSIWFAKMQNSTKHVIVGRWSKDIINETVLSTGFMGLKVADYALSYVAGFIRTPYFELTKNNIAHGATMSGIGNDDMKFIKLIIPMDNILQKYTKAVEPLFEQIDQNRQENQHLAELRDWLLPMLMNGQVEVI
ncbi:MAG: hypothetical protein LBL41_00015 [Bifidobacteriaceae bacterium]|jgi:type I restriction enzyme S subunit|nr:hypothetical protein [Bifidobacteriaceae bacterium]